MEQNKKAKRTRQIAVVLAALLVFAFGIYRPETKHGKAQQALETVSNGPTPLAAASAAGSEENVSSAATPLAAPVTVTTAPSVNTILSAAVAENARQNAENAVASASQNVVAADAALSAAKEEAAKKEAALAAAQQNKTLSAQEFSAARKAADEAAAKAAAAQQAADRAKEELAAAKAAYEQAEAEAKAAADALTSSQADLAAAKQDSLAYESLIILNKGITESNLNALSQEKRKKDYFETNNFLNSTGKNFAGAMNQYYEDQGILPDGQEYTYRIALQKDGSFNLFIAFESVKDEELDTPIQNVVRYNSVSGVYTLGNSVVDMDNDSNKILSGADFKASADVTQIAADALAAKDAAVKNEAAAAAKNQQTISDQAAAKQKLEDAEKKATDEQAAADAAAQKAALAEQQKNAAETKDGNAAAAEAEAQQQDQDAQKSLAGAQANADAAHAQLQQAQNQLNAL